MHATDGDKPTYLTLNEVAEHYRTTEATVRYWRHKGYGPKGVKVGARVLYPLSEIDRFDREIALQASDDARDDMDAWPGPSTSRS